MQRKLLYFIHSRLDLYLVPFLLYVFTAMSEVTILFTYCYLLSLTECLKQGVKSHIDVTIQVISTMRNSLSVISSQQKLFKQMVNIFIVYADNLSEILKCVSVTVCAL